MTRRKTRAKHRAVKFFNSVKAKLFGGFLAMTVLIAGLGGYALVSIGNAGGVVTDTFDRPLMAVNFARSASQRFSALEIERLRPTDPDDPTAQFDWLAEEFRADLQIARERSISPQAEEYFDETAQDFTAWYARERGNIGAALGNFEGDDLGLLIEENLDIIVELQANESFRNRETAIATMSRIRQFSLYAVISAIVLTLGLTVWIGVTIVRPLNAAAAAAKRISSGELGIKIPKGGQDETGQLLRTMRSMQSNIRTRMAAEQDLRTLAQHRLSDSLENSKDAVLLTDVDGTITVANPGVTALFPGLQDALNGGALVGRACDTLFAADGVPLHVDQDEARRGNEFRQTEGRWVRVNASATREGGRLFIWSDITESKDDAERLRVARDAAQAASRAKTLFLAAMSHEMNTPLNAIIGLSDVMKMQQDHPDGDAELANLANLISQSGGHMAQIVRDVLEIATDDDDDADLNDFEQTPLSEHINHAVIALQDTAAQSDVRLIWTLPKTPIFIPGDAKDLQHLATKLIDNAIKFNQPGGAVKVQLIPFGDDHVRLDVIDNGLGIAAENFERILQPFVQVDEGFTRAVDGTGLGLCVADRIAKRHGTKFTIRSTLGKGSVFSVLFTLSNVNDRETADLSHNRSLERRAA